MDRIRRALDLAREERGAVIDQIAAPRAAPDVKSAARWPTAIAYTRTQVFTPNPAILEANRIVDPGRNEAAPAAYRMLRTQVLQRMDANAWRSIAILSPSARDGKTTTAINLAVSLAHDHSHTVLLVECDLRRPSLAATLGFEPQKGLNDVLSGAATVEECLYHPEGFDRLVVLPVRAGLAHSAEALSGPHARELIAELRSRYPERIVLFDLPPVLGADDALAFLPLIDCGLVVAAERGTRREDLVRCMELLRKTPIVGTVLNRSAAADVPYG